MIRARSKSQQGFTLVEILLAMLVFLTGVAGLYALLGTGLSMQKDSLELSLLAGRRTAVRQLLEQQVQQRFLADPRALARNGEQEAKLEDLLEAQLPDGSFYRVNFVAGSVDPEATLLKAEVRISGTRVGLERALPWTLFLDKGPNMASAIAVWRARVMQTRTLDTIEEMP